MEDILRDNYKRIYGVFAILILLYTAVLFLPSSNAVIVIISTIISNLVINGWYWYCIKIYRNEENPASAFKSAFTSGVWIVILELFKCMISAFMAIAAIIIPCIIMAFLINELRVIVIVVYIFTMLAFVFTVLTEFIYYDNRTRGPILAVFDSISTVKANYFKVLVICIKYLALPMILMLVPAYVHYNNSLIIIRGITVVWYFAVFPVYTFEIIEFYEKVKIEKTKINDSLTVVAKALDENTDKY